MLKKIHNEWNKFYVAIYKKKKMAKIFNLWTVFLTVVNSVQKSQI